MPWLLLFLAGLFEIGWPVGFKMSEVQANYKWQWIVFSIVSMALSGFFLWMAQKQIPIGTAYVVWTGIGAAGTFIIGIFYFKDPATLFRLLSALLIVVGVIGLKISHG